MKHVFTSQEEVAHLWANQTQDSARHSSGSFYFDGKTIYSYGRHFPIAAHVTNEQGEKAILFTTRTYSNTTAKHIGIVWRACSHLKRIRFSSQLPDSANDNWAHNANFTQWQNLMEAQATHLHTARKPEKYLSEIGYLAQQVKEYAAFYGLEIPDTVQFLMNLENKEQYAQYATKMVELEAAAEAKRITKEKKAHAIALKKWLAGSLTSMPFRNDRDYLRTIPGPEELEVQTSQGVRLTLDEAKELWLAVSMGVLRVGYEVQGRYPVTQIGKTIKIGCHTFPAKYLIEFGNKLFKNETELV